MLNNIKRCSCGDVVLDADKFCIIMMCIPNFHPKTNVKLVKTQKLYENALACI